MAVHLCRWENTDNWFGDALCFKGSLHLALQSRFGQSRKACTVKEVGSANGNMVQDFLQPVAFILFAFETCFSYLALAGVELGATQDARIIGVCHWTSLFLILSKAKMHKASEKTPRNVFFFFFQLEGREVVYWWSELKAHQKTLGLLKKPWGTTWASGSRGNWLQWCWRSILATAGGGSGL